MLANPRNKEKVAESYILILGAIAEHIENATKEEELSTFERIREEIVGPWEHIRRRRPRTITLHWNYELWNLWRHMRKDRERENRSGLTVDWEIYEARRKHFVKENRRARRRFKKRTEELLEPGRCNRMAEAVRRDKRRREEKLKETSLNGKALDPANFTRFMGTF